MIIVKSLTILILVSVTATACVSGTQFRPNVYYEPRPYVQKKCTTSTSGRTCCKYATWYGKFETEEKIVTVCNQFDECSKVSVPKGGKWYEFFKWTDKEHKRLDWSEWNTPR